MLEKLKSLFGRQAAPNGVHALQADLEEQGYSFFHGADLAGRTDLPPDRYAKMEEHLALADDLADSGHPQLTEMIQGIKTSVNGYADLVFKNIALADKEGIVERLARSGYDPAEFRRYGLDDAGLYDPLHEHEIAHVTGNHGIYEWDDTSFNQSEFQTHALSFARHLERTGQSPDDPGPRLFRAYMTFESLFACLGRGEDPTGHGWTANAMEFVAKHWERRGTFWDRDRLVFKPEAAALFDRMGVPRATVPLDLPFGLAQRALKFFTEKDEARSTITGYRKAAASAGDWLRHEARRQEASGEADPDFSVDDMDRAATILKQLSWSLTELAPVAAVHVAPSASPFSVGAKQRSL